MEGIENILCGDNEKEKQLLWRKIEENNRLYKHEHPLLNPMLLTQIFNYASPKFTDLKSWRLVCKMWNELSMSIWRETATLKLTKETEQLTRLPSSKTGIPISKFLEQFGKISKDDFDLCQLAILPFQRYKLCDVKIDLGQVEIKENPSSKKFWKEFGSKMKYLHLERCTLVQSVSTQVPVETLILEKAPILEELVLTQVKLKKIAYISQPRPKSLVTLIRERPRKPSNLKSLSVEGKLCPFEIPEVIRCSKNLEKLVLKNVTNLNENLWKSLFAFRRLSGFQHFNLKEIDLLGVPNGLSVMDGLHMARLPVTTFRAQLGPGEELQMVRISAGFSRTLETLEIFGISGNTQELHNIFVGELPVLKELRLWGKVVKNLDFLQFMPKLNVLWINLLCAEKWNKGNDFGSLKGLSGDPVENTGGHEIYSGLEYFRIDYEFSLESLGKLVKIMPNLKNLETILNKNSFSVVGKMWPELEELGCLLGSRIDDGVVTGTRLPLRRRKDEGDGRLGLGVKQFRYLKTFRLDEFCGKAKLTDECLYNGFLEMFRLENLHICVSREMSSMAEDLLKQTIPNVEIIRSYDNVPSQMNEEDFVMHQLECLACKTEELLDIQWMQLVEAEEQDILEGTLESGEVPSAASTVVMMELNGD